MKYSIIIAFTFQTLAVAQPISATDILDCRKIENNHERLVCYDQIADIVISEDSKIVAKQNNKTKSIKKTATTPTHEVRNAFVNEFGLKPSKPSEQEVTSTYIGDLKGWDKNTKFRLSNGQVWKIANTTTRTYILPYPLNQPKVILKKGLLGSHSLFFPEIRKKVKVKRVK